MKRTNFSLMLNSIVESSGKLLRAKSIENYSKRYYPEVPKRFYKNVTVAGTSMNYEVNLDQRKLKTPLGNILQVPSYPLALGIAHEWISVDANIISSWMHLTALANSVIDNPLGATKEEIVNGVLDFLDTDTILMREQEDTRFREVQDSKWDPIVEWFNGKFNVDLKPSSSLVDIAINSESREIMRRHLLSFNIWSIAGIVQCTTTLKSLVLTMALIEGQVSVQDAVSLSLLEMDFQTKHWGTVEWCHGVEWQNTLACASASNLFVHYNTTEYKKIQKNENSYQSAF